MKREAVLHIPMSQYAHGTSENRIVIRIRTARNDLKKVTLYYGDTACRKNPMDFFPMEMKKVCFDEYFDYYEADFESPYHRIYYYFDLTDDIETVHYFADFFREDIPIERSEFYRLPFVHREDIADIPDWVKDAVIYNIFPDSFATSERYITALPKECEYMGKVCTSKLGGTIRGITENVSYLKNLGINCIYINPLFAAGEYHKYDTIDYFSVDPCFGTNEDFRNMTKTLHEAGIRVIIDGVFNHCGWNFFAFEDVIRNGEGSKYKDWFYRLSFPVKKPSIPYEYPNYECFAYEKLMPKLNTANPEVKEMILKIARFWIEEMDIDGWRLDVAGEINDDLWRSFRKTVKEAKKDAFIIGEIWEKASHWMQGDMYDSVMNYDLKNFCMYYFARGAISTERFNAGVTNMLLRYKKNLMYGSLNLLDSHDVPRFLSECGGNVARFKLAVIFQMMFAGVPCIFYGDEQCITGFKEPEFRSPMKFEENGEILSFYRDIIKIRKEQNASKRGDFEVVFMDEGIYEFKRTFGNESVLVVLNNSEKSGEFKNFEGTVLLENGVSGNTIGPFGYLVKRI